MAYKKLVVNLTTNMVRVTGFEPAVSAPPAQRFTELSYTL